VPGDFVPVVWENMTEPIIAGRELLGWSKIYSEISPASVLGNKMHCVASWQGFAFMDMTIENVRQLTEEELRAGNSPQISEGTIHHKFIPKTGNPQEADADYLTQSTNMGAPPITIKEVWSGDGKIAFHEATWRELPTMVNIVNTLASLEIKQIVGASVIRAVGGGMGETVILE